MEHIPFPVRAVMFILFYILLMAYARNLFYILFGISVIELTVIYVHDCFVSFSRGAVAGFDRFTRLKFYVVAEYYLDTVFALLCDVKICDFLITDMRRKVIVIQGIFRCDVVEHLDLAKRLFRIVICDRKRIWKLCAAVSRFGESCFFSRRIWRNITVSFYIRDIICAERRDIMDNTVFTILCRRSARNSFVCHLDFLTEFQVDSCIDCYAHIIFREYKSVIIKLDGLLLISFDKEEFETLLISFSLVHSIFGRYPVF